MLSEDLKALREKIGNYKHTGMQLAPEAVVAVCSMLGLMEHDARKLEIAANEPVVDVSDMPGNVVSILTHLGHHGTRDYVPVYATRPVPDGPEGGAA